MKNDDECEISLISSLYLLLLYLFIRYFGFFNVSTIITRNEKLKGFDIYLLRSIFNILFYFRFEILLLSDVKRSYISFNFLSST